MVSSPMARIASRKWTPIQTAYLRVLIDVGSSAASIAFLLKCSVSVIRAKARNLGKPFPSLASH